MELSITQTVYLRVTLSGYIHLLERELEKVEKIWPEGHHVVDHWRERIKETKDLREGLKY